MIRLPLALFLLGGLLPAQDSPKELQDRLKATVSFLASDEMKGRQVGTAEGEKAALWMAEQFEKIGLEKVTPDYVQKFGKGAPNSPRGINVIGALKGTIDEAVALCCHPTPVGVREGTI